MLRLRKPIRRIIVAQPEFSHATYATSVRRRMATATMQAVGSTDREASLDYIRPDSLVNRRYMTAGKEINTGKYEKKTVLIRDGRPELDKLTMDTTSFQLVNHQSAVSRYF